MHFSLCIVWQGGKGSADGAPVLHQRGSHPHRPKEGRDAGRHQRGASPAPVRQVRPGVHQVSKPVDPQAVEPQQLAGHALSPVRQAAVSEACAQEAHAQSYVS